MLESFDRLNYLFDPIFLFFFKLPVPPVYAYFLGMLLLILACTLLGELSLAGVYYVNRKHFAKLNRDMIHNHNLSVEAIREKDKRSYKACNSLANEAFGQNFFSHIALFASSLWPVPFVLSWMMFRFGDVAFQLPFTIPAIGDTVGNNFVFVPMYVLVRVLFARSRKFIPGYRFLASAMKKNEDIGEELLSWDIFVDTKKKKAPKHAERGVVS